MSLPSHPDMSLDPMHYVSSIKCIMSLPSYSRNQLTTVHCPKNTRRPYQSIYEWRFSSTHYQPLHEVQLIRQLRPLYLRGKSPMYSLNRKLVELQKLWTLRRRHKSIGLTRIRTPHRLDGSLVTIPNTLSRIVPWTFRTLEVRALFCAIVRILCP